MRSYTALALIAAVLFSLGCAAKGNLNAEKASKEPTQSKVTSQQGLQSPGRTQRNIRIGHYQCICRQGDFEQNLKTVLHGLKLASEAKLDIVSFPESFLTGFFRTEEQARANCLTIGSPQIKRVLEETAGFEILFMVGFNELRDGKLYNTVAVIEKGKLLGTYSKAFPIFRYFTPGREFPVFEKKGLKFAVIICADGGYIEPCRILALKGAEIIFAPHFNHVSDPIQHYQMVRNDHIARAVENGIYFLRANNVIPKEDKAKTAKGPPRYGYGDSYLLNRNGKIVAAAGLYDEYLMIYNLDMNKKYRSRRGVRSLKSATALIDILKGNIDSSSR
ncbi:MAG: carbon-nitrogen hydrolase family protein [Planctomycetota bacterium]